MRLTRIKGGVDRVLEGALIVLTAVMTLNVLWQVFTRFVLRDPSSYTEELARYLLIWLGVLGAAYAVSKRMHLAIDLYPSKQTGRRKLYTELFIESVVLLFAFFVMVIGGAQLVGMTLALEQTSAALGVKLGYVYLAIPLSGALIIFYTILYALDLTRALRGEPLELEEALEPTAEHFVEGTGAVDDAAGTNPR